MLSSLATRRNLLALLTLSSLIPAATASAMDDDAMTMKKWIGRIGYIEQEPSIFMLEGVASHVGSFQAKGEVILLPGKQKGTMIGEGVVMLMDARGDLLVGETTWRVDEDDNLQMHFAWCDSVKFSDGTTVHSTGAYAEMLPPDLTANGIIAILIGLLAPAH
jgi:hypothetical protein